MSASSKSAPTAAELAPERFPLLRAATKDPDRVDWHLGVIASGITAGAIRNADWQEAKWVLGRIAENSWKRHVSEPYLHAGRWETLPRDVHTFTTTVPFYGLHEAPSVSQRLAKTQLDHPVIDVMRLVVAELLPLAEALASLKSKVVKGRKPKAGPVPANPEKIVRTCPCCLRSTAVVEGVMVHHGYTRPGGGRQTASCPGIRFPPVEWSSTGLAWKVDQLTVALQRTQRAFDQRDEIVELPVADRSTVSYIKKGEPRWDAVWHAYVRELQSTQRSLASDLAGFSKLLREWKRVEAPLSRPKA